MTNTSGTARGVTIVTYHYVRDLARTRHPAIKGLDLAAFRAQLAEIGRRHTVVTAQDLIAAILARARGGRWSLPPNALLLTFDDGYADHFGHVFPLLVEAGVQGSFFVPACIGSGRVLDVNKIHFVLASVANVAEIVAEIFSAFDAHRGALHLEPNEVLYRRAVGGARFDTPDVAFVKRALQTTLPRPLRRRIVDTLFRRHVTADEAAFAAELYMDAAQLKCLVRSGMYIGGHGFTHERCSTLAPEDLALEIDRTVAFLADVGAETRAWIMSYPHGDGNETVACALRRRGCVAGFTTRVGVASPDEDPMFLPRLDTNDLAFATPTPAAPPSAASVVF